jgi:hypothetical protein
MHAERGDAACGGSTAHSELGTGEGGWAMAVSREREGLVNEGRAVVAPSAGLQVRWEEPPAG